ncbi:MAG TPA: hypothetical protein VGC91_04985 [Pyrinomonadaceae bacterium]|jgi:hypothetical protein
MGRIRRTSSVTARAVVRSNNLRTISPTLDLGGGLTLEALDKLITQAQEAEGDYNQTVAQLDEKTNRLDALLKQTSELSARLLAGVGARFGRNSDEYEKAGGVRTEEIKRTPRKKPDGNKKS